MKGNTNVLLKGWQNFSINFNVNKKENKSFTVFHFNDYCQVVSIFLFFKFEQEIMHISIVLICNSYIIMVIFQYKYLHLKMCNLVEYFHCSVASSHISIKT